MPSTEFVEIDMKILPTEGKLSARSTQTLQGNEAWRGRAAYNGDIEKLKDGYKNSEGMSVTAVETENFQKTSMPFVIKMDYDLQLGPAGEEPEMIMFNPLLYVAPGSSPFRQAERTHPINLIFSSLSNYRVEVEIPEGYAVEHLPEQLVHNNDVMQVVYRPVVEGDKIKITAAFAMKDIYTAEEYATLKTMYEDMVRAFSGMIVLKKMEMQDHTPRS